MLSSDGRWHPWPGYSEREESTEHLIQGRSNFYTRGITWGQESSLTALN